MDVNHISSLYIEKKIRIFLVFFSLLACVTCKDYTPHPFHKFEYNEQNQPIKLIFWGDGSVKDYRIQLKNSESTMFGNWKQEGSEMSFAPVIPFTNDNSYEVYKGNQLYIEFTVRPMKVQKAPRLKAIYPKLDTVPENLLKMYFEFDSPMQQTQSMLDFIKVTNLSDNKEVDIFLSLENELWNLEKTRLTLWLDPGRIKKDLIPNKEQGIPIAQGNSYRIEISPTLENQRGISLGKTYDKTFFVADRDEVKPNTDEWILTVPEKNTLSGLGIKFQESLDYFLIEKNLRILSGSQEEIEGEFVISKKANNVLFVPKKPWKTGVYDIMIAGFIEDLAGNNMNRLFDEDLTKKKTLVISSTHSIRFEVE